MLFVLLISLSATCLVFASGLANILASNLSGVLLNCSSPRGRPLNKKSPLGGDFSCICQEKIVPLQAD